MANWANKDRVGDPLAPGWQDQNLSWIEPTKGQRWQVYKPAAAAFEGLLSDLAAEGYQATSSGGFNYRNKRGGSSLSQHAFGTAIDVNAGANPMLSRGQRVVTNLPANTAELAAKHGLEWGGLWKTPDAMHFEWKGGNAPVRNVVPSSVAEAYAQPAVAPVSTAASPAASPLAPQAMAMMSGSAAPSSAPVGVNEPGGMMFGNLAAMFLQNQQMQMQRRKDEQDAEQARRTALFGGLGSLYG